MVGRVRSKHSSKGLLSSEKPLPNQPSLEKIIPSVEKLSLLQLPVKSVHPTIKHEKKGDLYSYVWLPYDHFDVQKRMDGILGPLSLYAPYSHELEKSIEDAEHDTIDLERPVTPIDQEIKHYPTSLEQFSNFVRRRIAANPNIPHMSVVDQQHLAGIVMGEVRSIWSQIRHKLDDPFLTPAKNKELNRRIAVHIVSVCELLFHHYIEKAKILNRRGVFSGPANMTRLKAQLALDISDTLDILTIRRHIVMAMREQMTKMETDEGSELSEKIPMSLQLSAHKAAAAKAHIKTVTVKPCDAEIQQLMSQMPSLDTSRLVHFLSEIAPRPPESSYTDFTTMCPLWSSIATISQESRNYEVEESRKKILLKRSRSDPNIRGFETLAEELGIDPSVRKDVLHEQELAILQRERVAIEKMKVTAGKLIPGTREYFAEDLRRLVRGTVRLRKATEEDELSPLLQAISLPASHDGLKEKLEKKLQELEEKEKELENAHKAVLQGPTHPQPATLQAKLPNQMVVRTSDVRVSDRICMSSLMLPRCPAVYNELNEELDPATIAMLDQSLFLDEETKEVYAEIMRANPKDHLDLDRDSLIVPAESEVEITGTMASASLYKSKSKRVLNEVLCQQNQTAPWGDKDPHDWIRTPQNPPKNFKGEDVFTAMAPDMEHINKVLDSSSEKLPNQAQLAENLPRTYASWLQWWKGTITSDDYMKYLSTQETDYLGAVFHFYDKAAPEEVGEELTRTKEKESSHSLQKPTKSSEESLTERENQEKLQQLQLKKNSYVPGLWNILSVSFGGLGRDPTLEDINESESDDQISIAVPEHTSQPEPNDKDRVAAEALPPAETVLEPGQSCLCLRCGKIADRQRPSGKIPPSSTGSIPSSNMYNLPSQVSKEYQAFYRKIQDRLEKIWTLLQFPDSLRLDMAIKYSTDRHFQQLTKVLGVWEKVTELIIKRESLLADLEKFERKASDPNRFFEKGGKSRQLFEEEKKRKHFQKKLEDLDVVIKQFIAILKEKFNDCVTFKGRPYSDKMQWDRVEMLYWLAEERKQNGIKFELFQYPLLHLKPALLDPIPSHK